MCEPGFQFWQREKIDDALERNLRFERSSGTELAELQRSRVVRQSRLTPAA
ncbi:hypothetical protein BH20VER2_BH20VER2_15080 [soil metagenome]